MKLPEKRFAAERTVPAHVGTNPAVLHRLGVVPAFRLTALAGRDASLKLSVNHRFIEIGLPHQQVARNGADFRAIEIQADTAHQILDHRFAEAGIRAALTSFGALIAGGNTGIHLLGNGCPSGMNPVLIVCSQLGPRA